MRTGAVSTRWKVPDRTRLCWRFWDGEFVVFHANSCDTHLLNPLAAEVLRALTGAPASAPELARHLCSELGAELDPELEGRVSELLPQLEERGLIEPVHP